MMDRRNFLQGACLAAVIAGAPSLVSAWTYGNGLLSPVFNGGRSQVNFNFLQTGGEYPFLDVVKTAQNWAYSSNPNKDTTVDPTNNDVNGRPTSIQTGGYYSVCYIPTSDPSTGRPGNYVCRWTSTGSASTVNTLGTIQSGSASTSTATGRFVFTPTTTRLVVGVISMTGGYVSSYSVMHVDDEAAWLAGQVFGTQFKAILRQAKFGVLRFLNWQFGNTTNVTTWATRKPIGYYSYQASEYRAALYQGVTANVGDDYSISAGISSPTDKQTVHLKWNTATVAAITTITFASNTVGQPITVNWTAHGFTAGTPVQFDAVSGALPSPISLDTNAYVSATNLLTNSFEVTLSPGGSTALITAAGTGASYRGVRGPTLSLDGGTTKFQVRSPYGAAIKGAFSVNFSPVTNGYATLVFDTDINAWLLFNNTGINSGVPPELMVRLAHEMGAHPWFVAPFLAVDPMTDWYPSLAAYCKANAPSWMIPRFEGPNEQWNTASGFYATRYGWGKAFIHWGANFDQNNWQGKIISTIGQAVNASYGGSVDGTKYWLICGAQTATFTSTGGANGNDARLTAASYVAQAAAPQSGYTKSAASVWSTHICITNYIQPSAYGQAAETTLAAAYAGGDQSALSTYADTTNSGSNPANLANLNIKYGFAFAWAQKFTNGGGAQLGMCGYEGGYSPDIGSGETAAVANLRVASSFIADTGKLLTGGTLVDGSTPNGTYNDFVAAGGLFPSCFQLAGGSGTGTGSGASGEVSNIWAVLQQDVYASPQPAQWDAIVAFNA